MINGKPVSARHKLGGRSASGLSSSTNNIRSMRYVSLEPLNLTEEDQDVPVGSEENHAECCTKNADRIQSRQNPKQINRPLSQIITPCSLLKPLGILPHNNRSSFNQSMLLRKSQYQGLPSLRPQSILINVFRPKETIKFNDEILYEDPVVETGYRVVRSIPHERAPQPPTKFPPQTLQYESEGIIALSSVRQFSDITENYPKLPPLPCVSDPNFAQILSQKLRICIPMFDFASSQSNCEEKDMKNKILCELVQLFENSTEARKLDPEMQTEIFRMLEKNIFSQVPVFPNSLLSNGYLTIVVDSAWPHLFYCFQIFNRFIQLFPKSQHINIDTARKVIKLMSIPDNNERLQLLAFIRSYYDINDGDRINIHKMVVNEINDYLQNLIPPYCIQPLLVFSSHIFKITGRIISPEYMKFMKHCVFPLFKAPHLYLFIQHYIQLLTSLFTEESPLVQDFLKYILHSWEVDDPKVKSARIELLLFVCVKLKVDIMKNYAKQVLNILSKELLSPHRKIVSTILSMWLKPKQDPWIEEYSRYAVSYMYENVRRISESHWCPLLREKASQTIAEMGRINRPIFLKMRNDKGVTYLRRKRYDIEHDALKIWARLIKDFYEVNGQKDELRAKLSEVKTIFDFKQQEKNINFLFPKQKDSK